MPPAPSTTLAVIGGSGFIGRAVVAEARRRQIPVRAVRAPRLRTPAPPSLDAAPPSLAPAVVASLANELRGCDVVVNAAGVSDAGSAAGEELYGANALLPLVAAEAAAAAGAARFVHLSSAAVQGRSPLDETPRLSPFSPYSSSKALAERWLTEREGPELVVVRPTSVHGPERPVTRTVARLAAGRLSSIAGRPRPTQQTRVETVAGAVVDVATHQGAVPRIVLTPDEGLTTDSYLRLIGGRAPVRVPAAAGRLAVGALRVLGRRSARAAAYARRLEVLWFGQARVPGWLDGRGATGADTSAWRALGAAARGESADRLLFGVTSGVSAPGFFRGQFRHLATEGWDVYLTCADEGGPEAFARSEGATYLPLRVKRNPSPLSDLRSLVELYRIVRRVRPAVCVWGSPKLGTLGPLVSRVLGVPSVYVIHGLRLETATGPLRTVLTVTERLACACATRVVAVGHQLRARAVELGLVRPEKVTVIRNGSANGVSQPASDGAPGDSRRTVGYVGRVTPDKGLEDLVAAWPSVRRAHGDAELVVAGAVESDPRSVALAERLAELDGARLLGHVTDLAQTYRQMGLLVLPSYREGLPNVVLEAASHGVPAVTTTATGAGEPVIDGTTGVVVPMRAPDALADALVTLLHDPARLEEMGRAAHRHVLTTYAQEKLWDAWSATLRSVLR